MHTPENEFNLVQDKKSIQGITAANQDVLPRWQYFVISVTLLISSIMLLRSLNDTELLRSRSSHLVGVDLWPRVLIIATVASTSFQSLKETELNRSYLNYVLAYIHF